MAEPSQSLEALRSLGFTSPPNVLPTSSMLPPVVHNVYIINHVVPMNQQQLLGRYVGSEISQNYSLGQITLPVNHIPPVEREPFNMLLERSSNIGAINSVVAPLPLLYNPNNNFIPLDSTATLEAELPTMLMGNPSTSSVTTNSIGQDQQLLNSTIGKTNDIIDTINTGINTTSAPSAKRKRTNLPQNPSVANEVSKQLSKNSKKSRRRPNCFLMYRSEKQKELIKLYPNLPQNQISCLVADMWKEEPESVRESYRENYRIETRNSRKKQKTSLEQNSKDSALVTESNCLETHSLTRCLSTIDNFNNVLAPLESTPSLSAPPTTNLTPFESMTSQVDPLDQILYSALVPDIIEKSPLDSNIGSSSALTPMSMAQLSTIQTPLQLPIFDPTLSIVNNYMNLFPQNTQPISTLLPLLSPRDNNKFDSTIL